MKLNITPDQIRARVLAQVKPFMDRTEYAVTDADIVDPCINDAIKEQHTQTAVISVAAMCIQSKLDQPDGLARIEKKIAARYARPVITRSGDKVTIDAGVVAGKLEIVRSHLQLGASPNLDGREWSTPEVVRFLKLGMDQYPDAKTYVATVLVPDRYAGPTWTYRYDRGTDRLEVAADHLKNMVYVSEILGGDVSRLRSVRTTNLTSQPR